MAFSVRKYPHLNPLRAVIFSALIFLFGCGIKKTVPLGQHLLKNNRITVVHVAKHKLINDTGKWDYEKNKKANHVKKISNVPKAEITAQILHRANKRVLFNGVPFYLWIYNLGTKRHHPEMSDSTKWRRKFRDLGEPPVLVDSTLVYLSAENIHNFFFNKGFLDAVVKTSIKYKKRKASVNYIVYPGRAYLINSFFIAPKDSTFLPFLQNFTDNSDYFRIWWPLDINKLNAARSELSKALRDEGYYTVVPESFKYRADTIENKKEAKVTLILENQPNGDKHHKYKFGQVVVNIETNAAYARTHNPKIARIPGKVVYLNQYPIKPEVITRLIYIDSGATYSQSVVEKTYQSLVQMGLFSIVDLNIANDSAKHIITLNILLRTVSRMAFSVEPQGLYSPQGNSGLGLGSNGQRSFGVAGIISFNNRNIAGHAENLRLSSVTSYEAIFKKDKNSSVSYGLQQGFNAAVTLPHFNLFRKNHEQNFLQRNTVLSLSYQYENNPYFFRSSVPASITFQWVKPRLSWYYTPTELSFNRNILSDAFKAKLSPADLAFIQRVFTNQFVTAAKVGVIYANNHTKPGQTYIFARAGMEASGNLHRLIRRFSDNGSRDTIYKLFGLQYFQYSKFDAELRLRRTIDALNSVAFRVRSGVALPYGNSSFVPYDKRYFIGGSNSLRAWRPRRLGPGSTPDTSNIIIDRSGEFIFEINLEYRFNVIRRFLESAIFLDAGNIWNLHRKSQSANSNTVLLGQNFFDEMALNTGLGFRFDFKIFLFRIDWGIPLHDPGKSLGNRWLINQNSLSNPWGFAKKETALAIGIGYPF